MGGLQGLSNITGLIYEAGNKQTRIAQNFNIGCNFILGPADGTDIDPTDNIPWYSFGFKDNLPHVTGYSGVKFKAANGSTYMDGNGVMYGPGFNQSSDIRLKSNIKSIDETLNKLLLLNPCTYTLNSDKEQKEQIGLIAQEVEEVFPQFVSTGEDGFKSINYASMVAICIKAIQELSSIC